MKRSVRSWQVAGLILALVMVMGSVSVEAKCGPKQDNWILFVDQSGSMYMTYWKVSGKDSKVIAKKGGGATVAKAVVAKQILMDMNAVIPELNYKGALDLFAPFQELQALILYNRATFAAAIKMIKDSQVIVGRQTPMANGMMELEQSGKLAGLTGKTTIVMFSDGMSNVGPDPVMEAKQILEKYPNVVVHVVSFAQPGVKDMSIAGKGMNQANEEKGADINQADCPTGQGHAGGRSGSLQKPGRHPEIRDGCILPEENCRAEDRSERH